MIYYILIKKSEEDKQIIINLDHVDIRPFQLPDSDKVRVIKDAISDIPSDSVKTNSWIDFSRWEDFHGIFHSGTKLSLHLVIMKIEDKLKKLKNCSSDIEWIDKNCGITINLTENFQELHKEFKITARRKKLRRLDTLQLLMWQNTFFVKRIHRNSHFLTH